jgi:diguanylate cyclase (GGDEF)-like protein
MVRFLTFLVALLLGAAAMPASAAGEPRVCFASADPTGSAVDAVRSVRSWDCRARSPILAADRVIVRLPARTNEGRPATYLKSGLGRFAALVVVGVGENGDTRALRYSQWQVKALVGGPHFFAALPQVRNPAVYYAVFDHSTNRQSLGDTVLGQAPVVDIEQGITHGTEIRVQELMLAMLIGMLLIPALFDLAVYKALRKAFFLWHAALAVCMALLVAAWSGLVLDFINLTMPAWHDLLMVTIGLLAAAASMFTRSFAVANASSIVLPRMLSVAAGYSLLLTAIYLTGLLRQPVLGSNLFSFALSPVFILLLINFVREFRTGDRPSQMQVLGWMPLLAFFAAQLLADFTTTTLPQDGLPLLYVGVLIEALLSAFGVSLRFLEIRRERDMAQARANVMGNLAERDHLTGLLNRRAIDNRFEALRVQGYDTLALIDLDHFKAINDVSGHAVGDHVLEITARVLASDPDNIAVRLGGEEFLILLRGTDADGRAEKLRRMLSVRVAREVDGLEQIVTASMGLLTLPAGALHTMSFSSAYSRADLLLYEAKRDGRNRTKAAHWGFFDHAAEEQALADGADIRDRSTAVA